MDTTTTLPELSAEELRVLGALIEKSKTTPDYYPMTLNALTAACNQKTSRNPVTDYDEETVVIALNSLKGRSLAATAVGGGSRVMKYKHNLATVYDVGPDGLAVLCLLMLRGPQTPGEIKTNAGRLYEFTSLEAVQQTLSRLALPESTYVKELARRPGQKETRYMHLLGGPFSEDMTETEAPQEPARRHVSDMESRLQALETEVAELRELVNRISKELF